MPKQLSRELRICLAIWRKAWHERGGEPLVVQCRTRDSAIAIRQSFYRAIKPYRTGEAFDEELRQASEFFVCYLDEENSRVIFKERTTLGVLEAEMEALGIADSDLLLEEEKIVATKLDEFIEEAVEERRETPFYTRDE